MIKLCNKMTISSYTIDNINETLSMCEHCQYYYNCDTVLELNDKLKTLEDMEEYQNKVYSKILLDFKEHINKLNVDDFKKFCKVLYRTFNFINLIEDMDIKEVNEILQLPREDNVNMTSLELMQEFKKYTGLNIE